MLDGFGEGGWIGPSNPGGDAATGEYARASDNPNSAIRQQIHEAVVNDGNTTRRAFASLRNYLFAGVEGRLPPLLPDPDVVDGELINE